MIQLAGILWVGAATSLGEGQEAFRSRDLSSAFLLVPQL